VVVGGSPRRRTHACRVNSFEQHREFEEVALDATPTSLARKPKVPLVHLPQLPRSAPDGRSENLCRSEPIAAPAGPCSPGTRRSAGDCELGARRLWPGAGQVRRDRRSGPVEARNSTWNCSSGGAVHLYKTVHLPASPEGLSVAIARVLACGETGAKRPSSSNTLAVAPGARPPPGSSRS